MSNKSIDQLSRRGIMSAALAAVAAAWWGGGAQRASAGERPATAPAGTDGSFEQVHALIKPHQGESRWMQVPWLTSVWEARKLAAAEGKPIFIWAGSGGGPVGVC